MNGPVDELLVVGFHATAAENIPSIMREGLKIGDASKGEDDFGVFFVTDLNWCIDCARQVQDPPDGFRTRDKHKDMAIIQLIVPYEWVVNEEYLQGKSRDEKIQDIISLIEGDGQSVNRTVPPSMLTVVKILKA